MLKKRRISDVLTYTVLIIASVFLLIPIVIMVISSLMSPSEAQFYYTSFASTQNGASGIRFIPEMASFIQYYQVFFRSPDYLNQFWNSIILTVPTMIGQIFFSTLAAYAFAKMRFPGRDKLFFAFIVLMMLPYQATLVPNFILLKGLNMVGQYFSVILPGIFTTFGVFLLRQFMITIPDEYTDAALIDGAGQFKVFWKIILPQVKGGMASLAILNFIDNWNMVEQPLILIGDEAKYPLSIMLSKTAADSLGIAFACGVIYMLPTILVFFLGEKQLLHGIQHSGIK